MQKPLQILAQPGKLVFSPAGRIPTVNAVTATYRARWTKAE